MMWRLVTGMFVAVLSLALAVARAGAGGADGAEERPEIPVAAVTIYPGEVIRPGMVRMRAVSRRYYQRGGFEKDPRRIIGKMAGRTLVRGKPIAPNALRAPYVVRRGRAVRVIYRSGALSIGALGMALESAAAGEMVAVRNVDSGRIIHGTAQSNGTVVVSTP